MPDSVRLRKATGGATLAGPDGTRYAWEHDGDVTEVAYDFAMTLLSIPGAGYSVADEPASEPQDGPQEPADEPADLSRRDASPTTPKPRAGTSKQPRQGQRASSGRRGAQQ